MIGQILHFLFHVHKYEIIEEIALVCDKDGRRTGKAYYLRCTICGKIKKIAFNNY